VARAAKYIALLGVFLAAVSAVAGAVAAQRFGNGAFLASAIAALLIWIVGGSSLALVASAKTPTNRLNCILAAMMIRMALPLVAVVFFTSSNHPLAAYGIAGLIVVHYLAGLVVETLLCLRMVSQVKAPGSAGGPEGVPVG
jgi:hypothetical protein